MTTARRVENGMRRQLAQWRATLNGGDTRLGWKIGFNRTVDRQKFDLPTPMVGYLTQRRRIADGSNYAIATTSRILIEPEIAVVLGADIAPNAAPDVARAAIAGYAPALELVDTTRSRNDDIEEILAGNMFHEAVLIGEPIARIDGELTASLAINGSVVRSLERDRVPDEFGSLLVGAATLLAAHGEQLRAGDWIITGAAATPIELHAGDRVELSLAPLGRLTLTTSVSANFHQPDTSAR